MDFTREPLVETVITPKEGYKLIIRVSNEANKEEYSVGAVEVVSFGQAFFFRSLEKPRAFLLPMSKYEVVEARETRTVLKKPQVEKSIKINGGKKPIKSTKSTKSNKEKKVKIDGLEEKEELKEVTQKHEKKHIRKSQSIKNADQKSLNNKTVGKKTVGKKKDTNEEKLVTPVRRTLLPPPTSLISEQIDRYKQHLDEHNIFPQKKVGTEEKIEELQSKNDTPPPFPFGEEEVPKIPSMIDDVNLDTEKVIDFKEESHIPPDDKDS